MNFFRRIFKIGEAEAHSIADKLEDPIKMTEQGIRDLKKDLDNSLKALAEVKALAIRSRNELNNHAEKAKSYEAKAIKLLEKAGSGELSQQEADRLAGEALNRKADADKDHARCQSDLTKLDGNIEQLDQNIKKLRASISQYENELKTLRARAKVSETTKKINKQMAQIDSGDTVSMLERMKEKVEQDEALAEAYGEVAGESKSLDDEIDNALGGSDNGSAALDALKARLNSGKDKDKEKKKKK